MESEAAYESIRPERELSILMSKPGLTHMRPPCGKKHTNPESGCSRVFPVCRSRLSRHPVSSLDVISVHRYQANMAAPHTSEGSVAIVVPDA
jgi:hypothetical protein